MDAFREIAETNNWVGIWPEMTLAIVALLMLVMNFMLPKQRSRVVPILGILTQVGVLFGLIVFGVTEPGMNFAGMLEHTSMGNVMRIFFLCSSILVTYLGYVFLEKRRLAKVEFFHIVLVCTAALMLLVQSRHFVMLFVSLETLTVGLFILVSYCRSSSMSLEAGLKFLILAALSSSLLLFGMVFLYGAAGNPLLPENTTFSMEFGALGQFIAANPVNPLVLAGALLVVSGLCFKIGAVPFQIWIPDVYQGAPTPVTAFLAVSSKAAGIMVLIVLLKGPFLALQTTLIPLLSAITAITILFGNVTALPQSNVKRLMGLSGISHAGFLLMGVIASFYIEWAIAGVIFYLFTYLLGSFAVFSVMTHQAGEDDAEQELEHYENFAKDNPFLGSALLVGLGSLAGIPPLAGFIGKLVIFIAALQAKMYALLAVAVIGVVISIYYYFGWMRDAFFYVWKGAEAVESSAPSAAIHVSKVSKLVIGLIIALTVVLGLYQGMFGEFIK